ncbi:uncharacterized hydrophobic domain-containing protein [Geodermatophilus obscurus]|uniref:Uncharacterized hydrophobic domain-containing protein n=1 Tax=Geodermatophilus obscurus TaxID=1861 RepID=A0A1I5GG37_9ACTN|nr:DUF389 domain-containing protein [Geodermatophilus obscurus]SFO35008.1 uncharacterized hydrophobic domain-containing protein [Geodermatophilus obscurus]
MVLGPEFAPLAGLAVALVHRRRGIARAAAKALAVGFVVAIALTALVTLAARGLGWFGPEVLDTARPQTGFITRPDRWSVVVAVLVGVAGVLSLTSARSSALVGVFISVTTVPAAADMAVSLALEGGDEFWRASAQLGIDLAGILVAAVVTLALQRALWRRVPQVVPRLETTTRERSRT